MARRRTRQRGGNCGLDHQTGGRKKSRRRRKRKGGGTTAQGLACKWKAFGSECGSGLSCQSGTCQPKAVSSGPSARTMGNVGSLMSRAKFWGGSKRRRRKSRRRRKRSRGRKSRRKRRTKRRRRR